MTNKDQSEKYTNPELREKLKEEMKASSKGGEPGQWSARKSQLLTQEYEKHGGGYTREKDDRQKSLEKWTNEEWQTQGGEARALKGGETARYLPKEAWEKLSDDEKRETEQKKREDSRRGEQYVNNTKKAKQARRVFQAPPLENYDESSVAEIEKKLNGLSDEQTRNVRNYERRNKNRKTLLERLGRSLVDSR